METSVVHVRLHSQWEMDLTAQVCVHTGTAIIAIVMQMKGHIFPHTVPDPCLSDPCDVNAICIRGGLLTDNFTCVCQFPFTEGNGFNCSGTEL